MHAAAFFPFRLPTSPDCTQQRKHRLEAMVPTLKRHRLSVLSTISHSNFPHSQTAHSRGKLTFRLRSPPSKDTGFASFSAGKKKMLGKPEALTSGCSFSVPSILAITTLSICEQRNQE
eukprot:1142527-Pelagomonas_calceolata.AAC.2